MALKTELLSSSKQPHVLFHPNPSVHRLGCWPAGRSSCLTQWVIDAWLLFSRAGFPCLLVVYLLGCSVWVFLGTHNVKLEFNLRVTIKPSFPAFMVCGICWLLVRGWILQLTLYQIYIILGPRSRNHYFQKILEMKKLKLRALKWNSQSLCIAELVNESKFIGFQNSFSYPF